MSAQSNNGAFDTRALRDALGQFATGVCVITTQSPAGEPLGMTANSFSSVSLAPPLISWCIGRDAWCFDAFAACGAFSVHVLAADQEHLSSLFAKRGANPFAKVSWENDARGVPLLLDCPVRFDCSPRERIDAGDHELVIADVTQFAAVSQPPLLFHSGAYRTLAD